MTHTTLSTLALIATLLGGLAAQPIPPQLIRPTTTTWAWPAGFGAGSFQRSVAGDFNGDRTMDLAVLRGARVYLSSSPEVMACFARFGALANATDLAVLTTRGMAKDSLVAIASGLRIGVYSSATGFSWQAVVDPQWQNVIALIAKPSTTGTYLAALHADRARVIYGHWTPATGLQYLATLTSQSGSSTQRIAFVDWLAPATPDVVMLQRQGLEIVRPAVGTLATVPSGMQTDLGFVTAIRAPQGGERVAWVTPDPAAPTRWRLRVVAPENLQLQNLRLTFPTQVPNTCIMTGLDGRDVDGDGNTDLLLSQDSSSYLVLLTGRSGAAPYATDPFHLVTISLYGAAGANSCPAILADINSNGRAEAIAMRQNAGANGALELHLNLRRALGEYRTGNPDGDDYPPILTTTTLLQPVSPFYFYLPLTVPSDYVGTNRRIELIAYHQYVRDPDTPESMNVVAESTYHYAIHGVQTAIWVPVAPPDGYPDWRLPNHYYFKIAFIDEQNPDTYSPSYLFGLAAGFGQSQDTVGDYYLRSISEYNPDSEELITSLVGGGLVGMVKVRSLRPPVPLDSVPSSGPPQTGQSRPW